MNVRWYSSPTYEKDFKNGSKLIFFSQPPFLYLFCPKRTEVVIVNHVCVWMSTTTTLLLFPIQRPAQSFLPTAFEEHISIRKECDNLQKKKMSRCLESSASQNLLPMKARWYRNCKMRKLSSTFPFTYSRFFLLLFLPFEVALESSDLICSTFTIPCAPAKLKDDRVVKGLGTCTTKGKYVRESSA